jgi:hypothetical protein
MLRETESIRSMSERDRETERETERLRNCVRENGMDEFFIHVFMETSKSLQGRLEDWR